MITNTGIPVVAAALDSRQGQAHYLAAEPIHANLQEGAFDTARSHLRDLHLSLAMEQTVLVNWAVQFTLHAKHLQSFGSSLSLAMKQRPLPTTYHIRVLKEQNTGIDISIGRIHQEPPLLSSKPPQTGPSCYFPQCRRLSFPLWKN